MRMRISRVRLAFSLVLMVSIAALQGCTATLQSAMGRPTFEPQSYGTPRLMEVIRDRKSSRADAIAAAKELRGRRIASIPEEYIMDVITNSEYRAEARAEFLDMLTERSLPQFKESYLYAALNDPDSTVSEKAAVAYYEWAETEDERIAFLLGALASPHPNMRVRAAISLRNLGPQFLDELMQQLKDETSASVAYAICEALADYRTKQAVDALNQVANDVERPFTTDALIEGKDSIRAEDVRAFAVQAIEDITDAMY